MSKFSGIAFTFLGLISISGSDAWAGGGGGGDSDRVACLDGQVVARGTHCPGQTAELLECKTERTVASPYEPLSLFILESRNDRLGLIEKTPIIARDFRYRIVDYRDLKHRTIQLVVQEDGGVLDLQLEGKRPFARSEVTRQGVFSGIFRGERISVPTVCKHGRY